MGSIGGTRASKVLAVVGLGASAMLAPAAPAGAADRLAPAGLVPQAPPEGAVPDLAALGWEPVLHDDFDGPGLDETIWSVHEGPGVSGPGVYTRDAVRVEDGALTVTTYSEDTDGDGTLEHYTGELRTGSRGSWNGLSATYGYIEARVRLNNPPATRSAFWMLSETWHAAPFRDPAAAGPEIDIFEITDPARGDRDDDGKCDYQPVHLPCDQLATGTLHWNGFDEDHTTVSQQTEWSGPSPQGNYLTYGLLWTPDGYRMYRNGVEVFHSTEAVTYSPEQLILTQHNWTHEAPAEGYGSLEESDAKMAVDYVRVWQRPISEVPDQVVGAGGVASVPFSVTDYHSSSTTSGTVEDPLGSVRVTATSSDQALLPDDRIVVTGNGPADPDGSFVNGSFDSGGTGWTFEDDASVWSTASHSPPGSLRLTKAGGRAEQTITGLRPDTTYAVSGWYNLELEWNDADGDGRVDDGEIATDDGVKARFDWGVADVDSGRPDDQHVGATRSRNGWAEQNDRWSVHRDDWVYDSVRFTTGPDTTEVTVYVDNAAHASGAWSSNVSVDSLHIRPVVPPNRTVALRPAAGASGEATVTLTAVDAQDQVLGTEDFTVAVSDSSFTNGTFDASPTGAGWDLRHGGADVVVDDPFVPDRLLELAAAGTIGTAYQDVTGLEPDTDYVLEAAGRVSDGGGDVAVVVDDQGDQSSVTFTGTEWETQSVQFRTGPTSDSVRVVVLDWDVGDGSSQVDDVRLDRDEPNPTGAWDPGAPELDELVELSTASSSPLALALDAPPGATVSGVTSSNTELLPEANVGLAGSGDRHVLSLSPVPDRTGEATLTVGYSDSTGAHTHGITVLVTDRRLANRGFEQAASGWHLPGVAAVQDGVVRSGDGALRLDGAVASPEEPAGQLVAGLGFNTTYVLGGWSRGDVEVTVRTVPDESMSPPAAFTTEFEGTWTGSDWTANELLFTTAQCPATGCKFAGSTDRVADQVVEVPGGQVEVLFEDAHPNDGLPVHVDDLYLLQVPAMSPLRELSLHQGHTAFDWDTRQQFGVGGVSSNARWDPAVVDVTSSDVAVLPQDHVRLTQPDPAQPHNWAVEARATAGAAARTGRSEVTVQMTDPDTGLAVEDSLAVAVNAGDNFNTGTFERGGGLKGWSHAWLNDSAEVVPKQRWRYLGPVDEDQVLRISSGVVGYKVTGLEPATDYVVQAEAMGSGSSLEVKATDGSIPAWGTLRGSVTIDSSTWAPTSDLAFTTAAGETEVWIFVADDDVDGDPVEASNRACALFAAGETCMDDISLFAAADL